MPYRAMTNILNFMLAVDEVVPGFAARGDASVLSRAQVLQQPRQDGRTLPDERMRPYVLGDSSGWTRGLMMASVMGWLAGRVVAEEL